MKTILLTALLLLLTACGTAPSAKRASVSFGVPGVLHFKKELANLKSEPGTGGTTVAVGDTSTHVQIGLFTWDSSAEGVAFVVKKK